jgi:hypothetical protein
VLGHLKFVLEEGACNETRDGSEATAMGEEQCRISLGCCGQAYTQESEKGHKIPKTMDGLGIFDKIKDPEKRNDIMGTIAVILDCICRMHMTSWRFTGSRIHIPATTSIALRDLQRFFKMPLEHKDQGGRILLSKLSVSPNTSVSKSTRTN